LEFRAVKVLLFSPMVRFGNKHYLQCVINQIEASCILLAMIVPKHAVISTRSKVYRIGGGGKIGVVFANLNPVTYFQLAYALLVFRPDCIHVLNGEARPTTIWLAALARLMRIRIIMTVHDPDPHPCARFDIAMQSLGEVTKRIVSDINIHEKVHTLRVTRYGKSLHVFPLPDIAALFPPEARRLRSRMVLFFGRIEPYKGLDNFVEAALRIGPPTEFVIAGSGEISDAIASRMAASSSDFKVFNRYVSDEEMLDLLDQAAVVLLPYHTATQSSIPAAAASRGAVPVGFSVGGLATQIVEVGGIVVPAGDLGSLVEAVESVLNGQYVLPAEAVEGHRAAFGKGLIGMYRSSGAAI
jgi:glycosyltransferase involved in cell wall biosynthesis